jgi:NAD(P)H-dependent flavin oxidoreductase YrpB (nitropropane dioxygenase family)
LRRKETDTALTARLTKRIGIRHPLLLAAMDSISTGSLAAAVTRAGGLGLLSEASEARPTTPGRP